MPAGAVWAVVGATGTGKSALSLQLAESLAQRGQPAEVVNADAMQLYRGMDIGTAKLPPGERRGIPHHLLDELGVHCEASVAWYQPRARAAIDAIHARGHAAILVGGSGLYVSSVLFDFRFPPRDPEVRAELEAELAVVGTSALFARLAALDPAAAERVDRRNGRRVVRALELHALGASAPGTLPEAPVLWRRGTRILGMRVPRAELVARLDRRVEQMWERGLLAEVRGLLPLGLANGPTAGRAIGYAQAIAQLSGERSESEAIGDTQALTRRYARRQVGWFSRYPDIEWVDAAPSRFAAVLAELFRPAPRPD